MSGGAEHAGEALMKGGRPSGHAFLDHTSEIVVRLHAPSFAELVEEAGRAFADLVPKHLGGQASPDVREFTLEGRDAAATLVNWMNELVFLADVERWVPCELSARVDENTAGPVTALGIRARGRVLERPFVLVKAATLHGVELRPGPDGIETEVTLDV
ncbi:MAG: archease [Gemmatimonadota bacterium]